MSYWKIAWRSIQERGLSSSLTALSMALGVSLVVAVLVIHGTVAESFQRNASGYDLIVGAKGGKLQLVLNTIYHLSTPIENVPWSYYREFREGKFAPMVSMAIPYCLGDNYQGYRVVGTTSDLFEHEYAQGEPYRFASGKNFDPAHYFEAVIGAQVARRTGLKAGEYFQPTHGVTTEEGQGHKHDAFLVVGVLEPTGTPQDRALFVNIEGFFLLEGHAKPVATEPRHGEHEAHAHDEHEPAEHEPAEHGDAHEHSEGAQHTHDGENANDTAAEHDHEEHAHDGEHENVHPHDHGHDEHDADHAHDDEHAHAEQGDEHAQEAHNHEEGDHEHGDHEHDHAPLPEAQREVTAILIRTANPLYAIDLPRLVNEGPTAQAVFPVQEIYLLFDNIVGNIQRLLLVLASLVVLVSGIGIMVSIYNSMSDRRREIGIMRSLGASRGVVMRIILLESILLSLGGGLAGMLAGHGVIGLLNPWIVDKTGVWVEFYRLQPYELVLLPVLVILASLVGILPAVTAYRTDVAKALSA